MAKRTPAQVRDDEPAYVLHAYPYRETSLLVEVFAREFGRVAMVARGAKRPRSELRGVLQSFQPLVLSWAGAGEVKTLARAQWRGGLPLPSGPALLCGFYLNELLLKLLPREDAHGALYDDYEAALSALAGHGQPARQAVVLRRFERRLLAELGYAMTLDRDVESGAGVVADALYHYAVERGPRRLAADVLREPHADPLVIRGATLLALAVDAYPDAETATEAKRLMRVVLDHHLEQRSLVSRRIVRDLVALDGEGDGT